MEFKNDTDHLDQHFLIDNKVLNDFINFSNINKSDVVVEVGPGKGTVTRKLLEKANKVIVIELDERLNEELTKLRKEYNNLEVIFGSVLDIRIPECNKLVTSLPYSIIEPFINKLITSNIKECTMLIGAKFANEALNKKCNNLSLLTNSYFTIEKLYDVLPESFNPKPHALSSIIKLKRKDIKEINNKNEYLVRDLYFHRDKLVKNALIESLIDYENKIGNKLTKKESKEIINSLNIDEIINNKKFSTLSNEELKVLIDKIENLK